MIAVANWARVDPHRLRAVDGDADLADGVRIVAMPGHTPGHQSLVVDDGEQVVVLGGQCCFDRAEFAARAPHEGDVHESCDRSVARASIARLHALGPDVVHLSHDTDPWRRRT